MQPNWPDEDQMPHEKRARSIDFIIIEILGRVCIIMVLLSTQFLK